MPKVKAVKAVTEVTLSLTGDEAEMLKGLVYDADWHTEHGILTEAGRFADELVTSLDAVLDT